MRERIAVDGAAREWCWVIDHDSSGLFDGK